MCKLVWEWICLWVGIVSVFAGGRSIAQAQASSDQSVQASEVMAWLEAPPAISNMLGVRLSAEAGGMPALVGDSVRSQEGVVDLYHLRWDNGRFLSRILVDRRDYKDLSAITKMACGGDHPNYWALPDGVHLACIESQDAISKNYAGSWTEKSVAAVLVVAAQKKIWEFLNLGLLRIRPGSIDWDRKSGQFNASSVDGRQLSGLLEIGADGILEAIQYWHSGEPLPQVDLNPISDTDGGTQSFNAFRVAFTYGERSKYWRIPSMFDVSHLISVSNTDALDPSLPEGEVKAHGTPFLRYQILSLETSDTSLPSSLFSYRQISDRENSPVDMRYTIYSNAEGHFRKTSTGGLISLRTVTEENSIKSLGRGALSSRLLYLGILVMVGVGVLWWFRIRTERV